MLLRVLDGQYNLLYWGAVPIFHIEKNKIDTLDATITLPLYDPPDWANYEQKVVSKDNPNIEFTVSKNDIIVYIIIIILSFLYLFRFNKN